jgi:hypothetical protein
MKNLITDLIKFQSQVPLIPKESFNPHFKSYFADLATVVDTCKSVLNKNKLCVIQKVGVLDGKNILTTSLYHESGEVIDATIFLPDIADAQKLTAAITYLRRTSYLAILGLVADTDLDGEDVNGRAGNTLAPKPANNFKSEPPSEAQLKAISAICNKKGIPKPDIKTNGEAFTWINNQNKGSY